MPWLSLDHQALLEIHGGLALSCSPPTERPVITIIIIVIICGWLPDPYRGVLLALAVLFQLGVHAPLVKAIRA